MSIAAGQRWTHVKRGTTYELIGIGELQMSADLVDGSSLVIYRGDDGKLWAREEGEFLDGRFEPVSDRYKFAPRMTPTNDAPVTVEETLRWYAENAAGCRKIGRDGDVFRQALDADGGKRALAALASAPAGDGVGAMREAAARLVEGYRQNATVNWQTIVEGIRALPIHAAALARPRASVGDQSREAIARLCYVPNRVALGPVEDAFRFAAAEPRSSTGRCVAEAYKRADAILALQSPPAKVEG